MQAVRAQLTAQQLHDVSNVSRLAADKQAVNDFWQSLGLCSPPCIPFLDQWPTFATRLLLASAHEIRVHQGDVLFEPWSDIDGVFIILDGRIDLHNRHSGSVHRLAEEVLAFNAASRPFGQCCLTARRAPCHTC